MKRGQEAMRATRQVQRNREFTGHTCLHGKLSQSAIEQLLGVRRLRQSGGWLATHPPGALQLEDRLHTSLVTSFFM